MYNQHRSSKFIEVCCSENSSLRQACKVARMPYLGITKNMQERRVLDEVKAFVVVQRNCGRWLHVHTVPHHVALAVR